MSTLVLVVSVSLVTALFTPGPDHDHLNVPLLVTVHVNDNDDCTVSGDSVWFGVKNSIGVAGNEGSKGNSKQIMKNIMYYLPVVLLKNFNSLMNVCFAKYEDENINWRRKTC